MLIRLVSSFVSQWEAAFGDEATYTAGTLPHWALSSFTPGEKEHGLISLYEVDETLTAGDVAAAMAFLKQSTPRWFFVGVPRTTLEKRGLVLRSTAGGTHHPEINRRHYDLAVPDRTALTIVAKLFLNGQPLNVEKREAEARLTLHARNDSIDWLGTAKGSNDNAWRHVREFTKKTAAEITGKAVSA